VYLGFVLAVGFQFVGRIPASAAMVVIGVGTAAWAMAISLGTGVRSVAVSLAYLRFLGEF